MPMELKSPERLLDHGQFLRGLAAALVRNPADADDVVQGAYTAALTKAPPAGWHLPQWLAGVTRNLARRSVRDRVRRQAREQVAVRDDAVRATDEVVELEELRQRVVQAVLALDDPYRSVVLMRFYDGLEPGEIARRQGVPAATVRSHLHRAVQQLRGQLDREQRPDRRPWTAVLLPFAHEMVPVGARSAAHSVFAKVGLAAALVITLSIAYPFVFPGEAVVAAVPSSQPAANEVAIATLAQPLPERSQVAEVPLAVPAAVVPSALLRFVEADGHVVVGAELRARFAAANTAMAVTLLDNRVLEQKGVEGMLATLVGDPAAWCTAGMLRVDEGGLEITNLPSAGQVRFLVARPGAPAFLSPACVLPLAKSVAFDVLLAPRQSTRLVRFVASDTGAVLADASVNVYTEFGDDRAFVKGTTVRTDARGECRLAADNLPEPLLIRPAVFWLETATHAGRFTIGSDEVVQEVRVEPRGRIEGTAFDLTGAPARDCVVALAASKGPLLRVRTDAAGTFVAPGLPAARTLVVLVGRSFTECVNAEVSVPSTDTVTMQLGSATAGASVSGRLTTGGQPLAGVLVMARANRDSQRMAKTDADGRYTLVGIVEGARFAILLGDPSVSDNFTIGKSERLQLAPGVTSALDFDLPSGTIAVSVLDAASGEPLSGVAVRATPKGDNVQENRFPGFSYRAGWAEATDGAGAATLRCLPEGEPHTIRIGGRGFVEQVIEVPQPSLEAAPKAIVVRVSRKG
jgi:RNA polymerase sigma-70 factor (ECF subfamily)